MVTLMSKLVPINKDRIIKIRCTKCLGTNLYWRNGYHGYILCYNCGYTHFFTDVAKFKIHKIRRERVYEKELEDRMNSW